jgi:hypothetical protein
MTLWDYLHEHGGVAWTWTALLFLLALGALSTVNGNRR